MSPASMSPPVMFAHGTIMRGMAEGIQKAAEEAEDEAQRANLSQKEREGELAVAEQLIESCQKVTEGIVSLWEGIRVFIRSGELVEKDLLTAERILKRSFSSGKSSFATVRGFIRYLQSHSLNPAGIDGFEDAASRLAAACEDFAECYADLKDPRIQESIRKGFEEAMQATGEPWNWEKELFGDEAN